MANTKAEKRGKYWKERATQKLIDNALTDNHPLILIETGRHAIIRFKLNELVFEPIIFRKILPKEAYRITQSRDIGLEEAMNIINSTSYRNTRRP